MYSVRYTFYPGEKDCETFSQELLDYLGALYQNGQVLKGYSAVSSGDAVEVCCIAPDYDSLDPCYFSRYCRQYYDKILSESKSEPVAEVIGKEIYLGESCRCKSPGSYVLFTTLFDVEPPVLCSDCGGHVPLYKLPFHREEESYGTILSWQSMYQACDTLYIQSSVGERFGRRQMSDPRSSLNVYGLDICSNLAAKTDKRFFYFLFTSSVRTVRNCPSCGNDWVVREEDTLAAKMDLVCRACGLVSISPG